MRCGPHIDTRSGPPPSCICRGLAFNQYLGDSTNYTNAYLHARLADLDNNPAYALVIRSWQEMNAFNTWALEALPSDHPVVQSVQRDMAARITHPKPSAAAVVHAAGRGKAAGPCAASGASSVALADGRRLEFGGGGWQLAIDPYSGRIASLQRTRDGRLSGETQLATDWAGGPSGCAPSRLLEFSYQVVNDGYYKPWLRRYHYNPPMCECRGCSLCVHRQEHA